MSERPKNPISSFVRQQRKALKMTQQDLADRAGVGIRFIRELEAVKPTLHRGNIVLELFGHILVPSLIRNQKNKVCYARKRFT